MVSAVLILNHFGSCLLPDSTKKMKITNIRKEVVYNLITFTWFYIINKVCENLKSLSRVFEIIVSSTWPDDFELIA